MSDSKKTSTPTKTSKSDDKSKTEAKDGKEQESKEVKGTPVVDLGFLEADDDFEEFPAEEWKTKVTASEAALGAEEEDERVNIWEDNWDDDNIEEDFSKQLKAELEKRNLAIR